MKVDVLTLFPAMFAGPLDESILRRARDSGRLELAVYNLRDWTHDRHRTVDDQPYGGGQKNRALRRGRRRHCCAGRRRCRRTSRI